jgi:hypothetical protein
MKDELENISILAGVTLAFLVFSSLLTLIIGRFEFTWGLTKGFAVLWLALFIVHGVQNFLLRLIRSNMYDKSGIFVGSNLLFSSLFCLIWVSLTVLQVQLNRSDLGWFALVLLYGLGLLSSYVGFGVVTTFYTGTLYRMVGLVLTVLAYVLLCIRPDWNLFPK